MKLFKLTKRKNVHKEDDNLEEGEEDMVYLSNGRMIDKNVALKLADNVLRFDFSLSLTKPYILANKMYNSI